VLHAVRYHEALKTASVCYKSCPYVFPMVLMLAASLT
jgi:hypothetical protein